MIRVRVREGTAVRVEGLFNVEEKRVKEMSRSRVGYILPRTATQVSTTTLHGLSQLESATRMKLLRREYLEVSERGITID